MKIRNLLIASILFAILIGALFFILVNEETYEYYNEEIGFKMTIPKSWEKSET